MQDTEVIERIKQLENENGELTTEVVIEDAKDENSPLHNYFQWDDAKAAHEWRKEQARRLIREVRLVIHETKTNVKQVAYVRNPDNDSGYVSTVRLRDDKNKARSALIAELERAESALSRAYDVSYALGLSDEIESLRASVKGVRDAA